VAQLIIGSFLLSLVHALIPNHWIPMVLIGKAEHWTRQQTLLVTALAGVAHASSTILLGVLIGQLGLQLTREYQIISTAIAPLLLVFMGLAYFGMDYKQSRHSHLPDRRKLQGKSMGVIVATLAVAMFFSPCLEIEAYYFTAGTFGWRGILAISLVYLLVSITGMLLLVSLGCKGLERFNLQFLQRHEKKIRGSFLIMLGFVAYYTHG
jgi:nickel/cobalt exporter